MSDGQNAAQNDAIALSWLDRLLDLDEAERAAQLQRLSRDDSSLHARLKKLLHAALSENDSRVLARPIIEGLAAAKSKATIALEVNQTFAGYRLLRELGRGGMSVVWLAEREDGVLKRQVALKLPLFLLSSSIEIERFAREKDVLAGLSHPNIARLYDAGVAPSGQPYLVLEFVDGQPITSHCDQKCMSLVERLRLFLQVLAAVDHAHKHLVVHRDLKPSNILVDREGQVKLLDFGIAKLLSEPLSDGSVVQAAQLTRQGGVPLSPLYAAPEQITEQPISTLTDVYVLGVLLHELLSGELPYSRKQGEVSLIRVIEALQRGEATLPSRASLRAAAAAERGVPSIARLHSVLTGDLDTIVGKAMSFAPLRRYGSVDHFAEDLRRYIEHRPIAARPQTLWYTARLLIRRHRGASIAAGIGGLMFLIAAAIALQQYSESQANAERTVIVRNFMFELVNDAEPNELQPNAPVTGKQMVEGAVRRARNQFIDQPRLQGELLSELGHMYSRLGERVPAKQVLLEALPLLERSAPANDAALNRTRSYLADIAISESDLPAARALAARARDDCSGSRAECAKVRAYANTILSTVSRVDGHSDQSLTAMRAAVLDTVEGFGASSAETAMALRSLAVVARNAGQLREASSALDRAVTIASDKQLPAADRNTIERTMAVLDFDLGRYDVASRRLTGLLDQSKNERERAQFYRLLANVQLAQGEPQLARETAESGMRAAEVSRVGSELLLARQARAQSLALLGQFNEALGEIDAVQKEFVATGRSVKAAEMLRARRVRAEILLRDGRFAESIQELDMLIGDLASEREPQSTELGQALDLRGCAARALGRIKEAIENHKEARLQLLRQLPADHPFLQRNRLYALAAENNKNVFQQEAVQMSQRFSPSSMWRKLIDAQIASPECPAGDVHKCVFVL